MSRVAWRSRWSPWILVCGLFMNGVATAQVSAAERIPLREDPADKRLLRVQMQVQATGKIFTATNTDKPLSHALAVEAQFGYFERRLAGTGRDAESLRAARDYDIAGAEIKVGEQVSSPRLRTTHRLIVAHGQREGVRLHCPTGPLSATEIELLEVAGDSLAVLALLPEEPVEPGDTWKPADWVLQTLTHLEAVEKTSLSCKFESLSEKVARIAFQGSITGATVGAGLTTQVDGHLLFDTDLKMITKLELTQKEQRSIGTVSPGMDVSAKVVLTRGLATGNLAAGKLTDEIVGLIPLETRPADLRVVFDAPEWSLRLFHDRKWHLYHQTSRVAVLRLMERGNLIAQCNINPLPPAQPGEHIAEDQFQLEVQRALGKNAKKLVKAERLQLKAANPSDQRYMFRVHVEGEAEVDSKPRPYTWTYYLVAAPDGRQFVFVVICEPKLHEILADRDTQLITSVEFLPVPKAASSK